MSFGIYQSAEGSNGASALASINNDGSLTIGAAAFASGNVAFADASITEDAIFQSADAASGADAAAVIVNAGTLSIGADATAIGAGTIGLVGASAFAGITDTGISQQASASSGGNASVSLINDGGTAGTAVLDIHAVANAFAATGFADASATIELAIYQSANASSGGLASVLIDNEGSLTIMASANATGSAGFAFASNTFVIYQSASASISGTASATLVNGGDLTIGAAANAISTRNNASATASVSSAISQNAFADIGDATVSLVNNGTISILADAVAVANTFAFASARD